MNEKPRLTRVRWVKDASQQETPPGESNPSWTPLPAEQSYTFQAVPSTEYVSPQEAVPSVQELTSGAEEAFQPEAEMEVGSLMPGEEEALFAEDVFSDDEFLVREIGEEEVDEDLYLEEGDILEQPAAPEAGRGALANAVLILVALYIVCGVAPLFVALFASLRVFFWMEVGGWAIILAWVVIGVRPPFLLWMKERARARAEQPSEQI